MELTNGDLITECSTLQAEIVSLKVERGLRGQALQTEASQSVLLSQAHYARDREIHIRQQEGEAEAYRLKVQDLAGEVTALKLRPITIFTAAIHGGGCDHSRECGYVNNPRNRPFVLQTCPQCAAIDGVS